MSERKYTDQSLKTIIQEMLRRSGMEKKFNEIEVSKIYHEVVGDLISRRTRDVKMRDKTLIIRVDSGPLKEELSYSKGKIAGLINEKLGVQYIDEVEVW
jgi:predicted nucleic acid-binding Zn ribbon protein